MLKAAFFLLFLVEYCHGISVNGDDLEKTCLITSLIDATIKNHKSENADWKEKLQGKVASAENEIGELKHLITELNESDEIKNLKTEMTQLKAALKKSFSEVEASMKKSVSEVYTRWGSTICPETADMVYSGYTAGSHFRHSGGGAHPVCLHSNPTLDKHNKRSAAHTLIYGSEYELNNGNSNKHDHDVPCAVCRTKGCSTVHMTPGKKTCEDDTWTTEYDGYLMSEHYNHKGRTAFICIDQSMDTLTGGSANQDGHLFYYVRAKCGVLKCPPYNEADRFYLRCVVCSK